MNTLFLAKSNGGMSGTFSIILFVGLLVLMYFTMIRPQKKQQEKKMHMVDELKKGDRVILIDGLHAKIDSVNTTDKTIVIDADGIYLTFSRMAVQQIIPNKEAAPSEEPKAAAETKEVTETSEPEADAPADSKENETPEN